MTAQLLLAVVVVPPWGPVTLTATRTSPTTQHVVAAVAGDMVLQVEGPEGYVPGLTATADRLFLWLGRHLATLSAGAPPAQLETEDDIVGVTGWEQAWLLVTELAVELRSSSFDTVLARYEHDEVLLDWRATPDSLLLTDLAGTRMRLDRALVRHDVEGADGSAVTGASPGAPVPEPGRTGSCTADHHRGVVSRTQLPGQDG